MRDTLSTLATATGIAGCMYGAIIALSGAISAATPCPYASAVKCDAVQQSSRLALHNGVIILAVAAASFTAGVKTERV